MRKLVFVIIALFALFVLIRAYTDVAGRTEQTLRIEESVEVSLD